MVNYEFDYQYGSKSETEVKPILEKIFGELQTGDRYSKYDFSNERYSIELKTRKNKYDTYPTTMITKNKIVDDSKKLILAFKFTDGLYYIEYDKQLFDKFNTRMFSRAYQKWDEKPHIYIPIEYLTRIE